MKIVLNEPKRNIIVNFRQKRTEGQQLFKCKMEGKLKRDLTYLLSPPLPLCFSENFLSFFCSLTISFTLFTFIGVISSA